MPNNTNKKSRSFRGRRSRRPKVSFETRVLQAIRSKKEIKIATRDEHRTMSHDILNAADLYDICPTIPQGVQEKQRLGNKINLLKVVVRGYFSKITSAGYPVAGDENVLVRHMIVKQKNSNWNQVGPGSQFDQNVFLEHGQPYIGTIFNHIQPVNKNAFSTKKTLRMKLDGVSTSYQAVQHENGTFQQYTAAATDGTASMVKPFSYTLRFGKQGKTLDYQTDGAQQPVNWDYFMTNTAQRAVDGQAPTAAQITYTVDWYYTDA